MRDYFRGHNNFKGISKRRIVFEGISKRRNIFEGIFQRKNIFERVFLKKYFRGEQIDRNLPTTQSTDHLHSLLGRFPSTDVIPWSTTPSFITFPFYQCLWHGYLIFQANIPVEKPGVSWCVPYISAPCTSWYNIKNNSCLSWGKSVLIKWRQCIKQFTSKSLATNLVTKKIQTLGMCINLNKLSLCHFYTLEVAFSQASKSILHGFICRDLVGNESRSFITLKQQRYLHHRNLVKNWKAKELWSAGKWKAILYHLAAMAGLQVSLLDICDARSWNSCCCWS